MHRVRAVFRSTAGWTLRDHIHDSLANIVNFTSLMKENEFCRCAPLAMRHGHGRINSQYEQCHFSTYSLQLLSFYFGISSFAKAVRLFSFFEGMYKMVGDIVVTSLYFFCGPNFGSIALQWDALVLLWLFPTRTCMNFYLHVNRGPRYNE